MEAPESCKVYMGDSWSEEFCRLADLQLRTKDGHVLPAHSQLLAKESKVVATMLDIGREAIPTSAAAAAAATQQAGQHASHASGKKRKAEGALPPAVRSTRAGAAYNSTALSRVLGGYSTPAVQLFLPMVCSRKKVELRDVKVKVQEEVVRLADQLDAPGILSPIDSALAAIYGGKDRPGQKKRWLELFSLADRHGDKLPLTYQAILSKAERVLRGRYTPDVQEVLEGKTLEGLSSKTLCDLIRKLLAAREANDWLT